MMGLAAVRLLSVNSRQLLPTATKSAPATDVKFSAVTGASPSLSPPPADSESAGKGRAPRPSPERDDYDFSPRFGWLSDRFESLWAAQNPAPRSISGSGNQARRRDDRLPERPLCGRGCFDLHEDRGMEEASHAEKRRCRPTAGLGQPSQACGRRLPKTVDISRVIVEAHDVRELQAGVPENRFDVVDRLPDLRTHVARMLRCAAGIDRRLPRADDGTLRPAHLVGLHEAKGVLPGPRIDHTSLHGGEHVRRGTPTQERRRHAGQTRRTYAPSRDSNRGAGNQIAGMGVRCKLAMSWMAHHLPDLGSRRRSDARRQRLEYPRIRSISTGRIDGIDADVGRTRFEVLLDPRGDLGFAAPGHQVVDEAIAAPIHEVGVLISESP